MIWYKPREFIYERLYLYCSWEQVITNSLERIFKHPKIPSACGMHACSNARLCPTLCDCSLPMEFLCSWNFPGENAQKVVFSLQGIFHPGIQPASPALLRGFFTTEPLGTPMGGLGNNIQFCFS